MTDDRTVFLHVGMHKTASTYIQNRLRKNRDLLANHKLLYLPMRRDHLKLVRAVDERHFDAWMKWLQQADQDGSHLLVSAEALSIVLAKTHSGEAGGPWLTRQMRHAGWSVKVLAFVRDQPSYLNSRYTQLVKRLHTLSSFKRYVRHVSKGGSESECDMNQLFGWLLAPHSPESLFIPFGRDVSSAAAANQERWSASLPPGINSRDPFDALLSCLPISANLSYSKVCSSATNQQPGDLGVRLARRLGRHLRKNHPHLFEQSRTRAQARVQVERLVARHNWQRTPFNGLTPALWQEIRATYAHTNDSFARAVWGDHVSWYDVFPDELPRQLESANKSIDFEKTIDKMLCHLIVSDNS